MKQQFTNSNQSLDSLPLGTRGVVSSLTANGVQRRRMLDLGLVEGAEVAALHQSPSGDPTAYSVMGAVIALRRDDARKILLESNCER
ncbi:FeoA family protein [Bacilliculturomica massiliensis]|uniref:FeoA family protein n=1 Tax=Bacilliculturomica massiliensis TaxID=1917867 RepID=UPI001030F446|nr:FeoA family protein [Bacilliculturomica massiliensis]